MKIENQVTHKLYGHKSEVNTLLEFLDLGSSGKAELIAAAGIQELVTVIDALTGES